MKTTKGWDVIQDPDNKPNFHTIPVDDLIPHIPSVKCNCRPKWIADWDLRDGVHMWIFSHNALDGRE